MHVTAIHEVINHIPNLKSVAEKVEWLQKHDSRPLRNILILTYDRTKELYVPDVEPPYKPSTLEEIEGMLLSKARMLNYIVKGFSDPNVPQAKREDIFINLLESVHAEDAKILIKMIKREPFPGLTAKTINKAFGDIINVS